MEVLQTAILRLEDAWKSNPDVRQKESVRLFIEAHRGRFEKLNKLPFDQGKYDELTFDVAVDLQRMLVWLSPPKTPASVSKTAVSPDRLLPSVADPHQAEGASKAANAAVQVVRPAQSAKGASAVAPASFEPTEFTDRYCSSCHNDVDKEGGLDLTTLSFDLAAPETFTKWVKIHDRVQAGEMPPKEKRRPGSAELAGFVRGLSGTLEQKETALIAKTGRATRRRLNRTEYEHVLRDLLSAPWLQLKEEMPEDGEAFRFNKIGEALDVSHVHITRYMRVADTALREVIATQLLHLPTTVARFYARDEFLRPRPGRGKAGGGGYGAGSDRGKFPLLGSGPDFKALQSSPTTATREVDPSTRELEAVGWVSSNYVTGFTSGWSGFRAPVSGRYRLRFSGYSVWVGPTIAPAPQAWIHAGTPPAQRPAGGPTYFMAWPVSWYTPNPEEISLGRRSEPVTVYAKGGTANRLLGDFDLLPNPATVELNDVWLNSDEFIVTDANRFFRSRPTGQAGGWTNALAQADGQPAVAFRWMEVEGPIHEGAVPAGYRLLFDELPVRKTAANERGVELEVSGAAAGNYDDRAPGAGSGSISGLRKITVDVVSQNPAADAERLLRGFVARAYRRPPNEEDIQLFLGLIRKELNGGAGFAASMIAGYTAVLASPGLIYVDESVGPLDNYAVATRLALFLWNSEPDQALKELAVRGELRKTAILKQQVERMLKSPKSTRFIAAFLDYWLELRKIDDTSPSTTLYNDYYIDDSLPEAALAETRLYVADMLERNLPARNIVDSDYTYLNERLASHYGIPNVEGGAMRRVTLLSGSVRGGLMTQASILKVTANGTTTSPVLRGKWIMERIVGFDMPPPPAAVPAVEPDIRGAVTIRQQLDKHRADESCAMCHRKIDPPGFALENFDVLGGWRESYRATGLAETTPVGFGKNGWPYMFHFAQPVDASGVMADGREFSDIRAFKRLLLSDEEQIARNFVRQLTVYATGAPVRFSDRKTIEGILERTRSSHFGIKSILLELIQSEVFLSK